MAHCECGPSHDKAKPVARRGRKAMGLSPFGEGRSPGCRKDEPLMNRKTCWAVAAAAALLGTFFVRAEPQARPERRGPETSESRPQYERRNAIVEAVEKSRESIVTLKMTKHGNWGTKEVNGCGV